MKDLKQAQDLLHQVAMRLSSGKSITPDDFLYAHINEFLAPEPKPLFLSDRADGVSGHYCISRMQDNDFYVEHYYKGKWTAFGEVFTEEQLAQAMIEKCERNKNENLG